MRDFHASHPSALAAAVLEEIPGQMLGYFKRKVRPARGHGEDFWLGCGHRPSRRSQHPPPPPCSDCCRLHRAFTRTNRFRRRATTLLPLPMALRRRPLSTTPLRRPLSTTPHHRRLSTPPRRGRVRPEPSQAARPLTDGPTACLLCNSNQWGKVL